MCKSKIICFLFIILILFISPSFSMYLENRNVSVSPKFIPNQIIVKFKEPPSKAPSDASTISSLNKMYGAKAIEEIKTKGGVLNNRLSNIYKITISKGIDIASIADSYKNDPNVEYAEPNVLFETCVTPNDPGYPNQWGLSKIQAEGGWDAEVGSSEVVIAIVDTGVNYNHGDLASNIWINKNEIPGNGVDDDGNGYVDDVRGWNFVSVPESWLGAGETTGPNNDPMDHLGHGTHVAGIAAGTTNNGIGTAGLSWKGKIMAVRAGYKGTDGYGYLELTDAASAIIYAADSGANIINMSWGSTYDSSLMRDAIDYAANKGCILVAAAGNVTSSTAKVPFYPAAYPNVIAVASTDEKDQISIWSWTTFSNFGDFVDLTAPGTYIYSTLPGGYGYLSGTSMATPFVSGLAALVKSKYTSFSALDVENKIKETSDNIYPLNPGFLAGCLGAGRINAFAALGKPRIKVTYPKEGGLVGGNVMIEGSADIEDFLSYKVEYREKSEGSNWKEIGNLHNQPVIDSQLENWDATGLSGDYILRLTVSDTAQRSYTKVVSVKLSPHADPELTRPPLNGPNPFNPQREATTIYYRLGSVPAGGTNVDIYIYDITGTLLWRDTKYSAGVGENWITWNGVAAFGDIAANGVYPYLLAANGRGSKKVIGKSRIAVLK